jgi:hypothetical protein
MDREAISVKHAKRKEDAKVCIKTHLGTAIQSRRLDEERKAFNETTELNSTSRTPDHHQQQFKIDNITEHQR